MHPSLVLWEEEEYVEHVEVDESIHKWANVEILNTGKLLKSLNSTNNQ